MEFLVRVPFTSLTTYRELDSIEKAGISLLTRFFATSDFQKMLLLDLCGFSASICLSVAHAYAVICPIRNG